MEAEGEAGYGKAARGRRHRTQGAGKTPYSRPPPPEPRQEEPLQEALGNQPAAQGLLGSLLSTPFRLGASLITKVRREGAL